MEEVASKVVAVETLELVVDYQVDAHPEPKLDDCSTVESSIITASSDIKGDTRHSTVDALDIKAVSTLTHAFHNHNQHTNCFTDNTLPIRQDAFAAYCSSLAFYWSGIDGPSSSSSRVTVG